MTHLFILCYLILIARIVFHRSYFFLNNTFSNLEFSLFAYPLSYLNLDNTSFLPLFYVVTAISILVCCFYYKNKTSHIIAASLYLLLISFLSSNGKVNHSEHCWILISIGICFINVNKNLNSSKNILVIRTLQGLLLSHYVISGVWKLRNIIRAQNLDLKAMALNNIAIGLAEGSAKVHFILNYLLQSPNLILIGFVSVLIFQISCLTPILTRKYYKIWAILCCLFHVSTDVTMGIRFTNTQVAILFLLLFTEVLINYETHNKKTAEAI